MNRGCRQGPAIGFEPRPHSHLHQQEAGFERISVQCCRVHSGISSNYAQLEHVGVRTQNRRVSSRDGRVRRFVHGTGIGALPMNSQPSGDGLPCPDLVVGGGARWTPTHWNASESSMSFWWTRLTGSAEEATGHPLPPWEASVNLWDRAKAGRLPRPNANPIGQEPQVRPRPQACQGLLGRGPPLLQMPPHCAASWLRRTPRT